MDLFCDERETTRRYGQYVSDLRRLFVFHGLRCGAAEDFGALAAKLLESAAFRTDVSALARSIRDFEANAMSADEMLTVMALASGGEELVEGRAGSIGVARTAEMLRLLLAGIGGWKETNEVGSGGDAGQLGEGDLSQRNGSRQSAKVGETGGIAQGSTEGGPVVAGLTAHAPASGNSKPGAEQVGPPGPGPSAPATAPVAPEIQGRLELAITELKVYLDDIDRRIGRMEPRLEDITQIVHTSAELFQRPGKDAAEVERSAVPEGELVAASLSDETSAAPVRQPKELRPEQIHQLADPRLEEVPVAPAAPTIADPTIAYPTIADPLALDLSVPVIEGAQSAIPAGQRGGDSVMDRRPERSRRQQVGRLVGVAAVLLAAAGVAISFLSPNDLSDPAKGTGQSKQVLGAGAAPVGTTVEPLTTGTERGNDAPENSSTGPRPEETLHGPGHAPTDNHPVPALGEQRPPARTAPVSGGERTPVDRVAGRRSIAAGAEPRLEGRLSRQEKLKNGEDHKTLAAGVLSTDGSRGPHVAGGVRPKEVGSPEPAAPSRSAPAEGTPLIVPPSGMNRNLISARPPVYPPEALRQHLEGRVVLNAFIAKDGTVRRMDVVEGSTLFTKSAMAAVSWRRYRPYLVRGKPVEVQTQITVNYP